MVNRLESPACGHGFHFRQAPLPPEGDGNNGGAVPGEGNGGGVGPGAAKEKKAK